MAYFLVHSLAISHWQDISQSPCCWTAWSSTSVSTWSSPPWTHWWRTCRARAWRASARPSTRRPARPMPTMTLGRPGMWMDVDVRRCEQVGHVFFGIVLNWRPLKKLVGQIRQVSTNTKSYLTTHQTSAGWGCPGCPGCPHAVPFTILWFEAYMHLTNYSVPRLQRWYSERTSRTLRVSGRPEWHMMSQNLPVFENHGTPALDGA